MAVVVVVPVYRFPLLPEEEISLRHLRQFLFQYETRLVAPHSLRIEHGFLSTLPVERFTDSYFKDIGGYNRLMLGHEFYARFREFEYLLTYQLDCLVFSDQLSSFCSRGWDYVGAPWFPGYKGDTSRGFWRTGNGGLSLRRVPKFLAVLESRVPGRLPDEFDPGRFDKLGPPLLQRLIRQLKYAVYACGYKNTVNYVLKQYPFNEDGFWSMEAERFTSNYVVPRAEEALPFAFEYAPRFCYEANGRQLPFGCHGWYKIDRQFWEPFLLRNE